jgi:NitT/TauT family transport system substrate-binding protein
MVWIRRALFFCFLISISITAAGETSPSLRFSLPPVLEALPIAFAQEWDLFEAHGVSVELIGITDNQQRSAALMTGNLDGMMEDVTRSILDATAGGNVVITSAAASRPQTGSLALALLSPTSFRLDSFDALLDSDYAIGTLYRSDYEYLLDRLLADRQDEDTEPKQTLFFHDMLQMAVWFGAQTLPAAVLPEPYITYLATYHPPGGKPIELVIHDDFSEIGVLPAVVVFRRGFVEDHAEAVAAFYAAYTEAIERINSASRDELIDVGIDVALSLFFQGADRTTINQEVLDAIPIPVYDSPTILDRSGFEAILAWMLRKGYVFVEPTYEQLTDFQFVR